MTNLEKLNTLLANNALKIPDHVRTVHASGKNLQWLKKNLSKSPSASPELVRLLNMQVSELHKAYIAQ